jgi:hypothetical protein
MAEKGYTICCMQEIGGRYLWCRDAEIFADLPGELVGDLRVAGYGGGPLRLSVDVDGVPASFPLELAALLPQVLQERPTLHAPAAPMGSRTTSLPPNSLRVSSLLASRTSETASLRLSRHSSRVSPWAFAPGSSST